MADATKVDLGSLSSFRGKNRSLVVAAAAALQAENPMTLRQLFYRLVSGGDLRNEQKEYKRLGRVMTGLREAETIPRTWIVDHIRSTLKPSSWSDLADFGETVRNAYRKNFWAALPDHVEVFVEKDAVAGTVQPVTESNDIRLHVCRGYSSVSFAGEVADLWRRVRKPIHAYYLGDFDPSGFDLERDLREKLERYSGRECAGEEEPDAQSFRWVRLGVRPADFVQFNLVRLPVKAKDRRSAGFRRTHGDDCAELDALPPSELRRRVEEAIDSHIDTNEWNRLLEVERVEQESLDLMVQAWERREQA